MILLGGRVVEDRLELRRTCSEGICAAYRLATKPCEKCGLGLGEIDPLFDWLDKAVEERDTGVLQIPATPFYDPLRFHPRCHALLRKMNLEP